MAVVVALGLDAPLGEPYQQIITLPTVAMNAIHAFAPYAYARNPSVKLEVNTANGTLVSNQPFIDTYYVAGAYTTRVDRFSTEAETPNISMVTDNYNRLRSVIDTVTLPVGDVNNFQYPLTLDPDPGTGDQNRHLRAMTQQDFIDTFVQPALDALDIWAATTNKEQAGTYFLTTTASPAGATLVSTTPVAVNSEANIAAYTGSGIPEATKQTLDTNYYLAMVDPSPTVFDIYDSALGTYDLPLYFDAGTESIRQHSPTTWSNLIGPYLRYYLGAPSTGYQIEYNLINGTQRGSTYVDTRVTPTGTGYNTLYVNTDDYRTQEFPTGTSSVISANSKALYINRSTGVITVPTLLYTLDNPNAVGTSELDFFGWAVAITSSYVIVAASSEDTTPTTGLSAGKVYVFSIATGGLLYTIDNPNAYSTPDNDNFGQNLAADDTYLVASATAEDDAGGTNSGKVYVFNIASGVLLHTIDNPNVYGTSFNDVFGTGLSINNGYITIGANGEELATDNTKYSGHAYVFDASTGALVHSIDNPNIQPNPYGGAVSTDLFGQNSAMNDTSIFISAAREDAVDPNTNASEGVVYAFNRSNKALTWTIANPNAYGTTTDDQFGENIAVSGYYLAVGVPYEDDAGGLTSGKVYVFNTFSKTLVHTLDNPNAYNTSAGDWFGSSVAIDGNYLIVGAQYEDDAGGTSSGKAYIFNVTTGALLYTIDNPNAFGTSASDQFGIEVGIKGEYAVVSAMGEGDSGGIGSGKAYIYKLPPLTLPPQEFVALEGTYSPYAPETNGVPILSDGSVELAWKFGSDGTVADYNADRVPTTRTTGHNNWNSTTPTGTWYIRITYIAGDGTLWGAAMNTWHPLTADVQFGMLDNRTQNTYGPAIADFKVEISRNNDGTNIEATGYYTLTWEGGA